MTGLTDAGFVPARLDEIRSDLEDAFRVAFGNNVQVSATSVFGQIIAIMAERYADLWEQSELVYSSAYLNGATGAALDDLLAIVGGARPGPTFSIVTLTLGGTPATSVPAGSIFADAEGIQWITDATAIIGGGGTVDVEASPALEGPIVGLSGTITEIVTPVAGLTSVTNALDADVGRFAYSDAQARSLTQQLARSGGGSSLEGLRALLLRLDDVTEVAIAENTSDVPDVDGRPGHSFEAVVRGGDDQSIADLIWSAKPAGIETVGTEASVVVDAAGDNQDVNWSRPVEIDIYIEVTYSTGDGFPLDGEDLIEAAILEYGDSFTVGKDVIPFEFIQRIEVPGITDLFLAVGLSASPINDTPLVISRTQLAVFDSSRTTFIVV